jgi:hypothetical protein
MERIMLYKPPRVHIIIPVAVMHSDEVAVVECIEPAAGEGVGVVVGAGGSGVVCGVCDVGCAVGVVFAAFDYAAGVV